MTVYEKAFVCRRCGGEFHLRARYAYYCAPCGKKVRSQQVMRSRAARNPCVVLGVGSGGNQWGEKNHQFKDGLSHYKRNYEIVNPQQRCCEICGSMEHVVVHHIDQNRRNNRLDNLMMICRSCHAQVHGLVAHLGETPMVSMDVPIVAEAAYGTDFGHMAELEA